ncbi:acyltransferase family protein [Sphingobacterium siyangense]|uniref:acyltransferase family protein n=1 Tax=Sphingobacterium siyangense TaxID=459529 RepID=UPI0019640F93|nr:acyltransferase family protein [Sphingobacterium siyangense]QRY58290.1 acyltransferase family protein [Sphingobacterium siyangense]
MERDHSSSLTSATLLSKTIDFLRFPLIVGVVLIHTDFSNIIIQGSKQVNILHFPVFAHVFFLFSKLLFEVCVPLFFFISGFLFFYRTESFTFEVYLKKLKSRLHSLFIPYIFWNLAVLFFFFLAQTFFGGLLSGVNKPIVQYSISDWLWSFWDTSHIHAQATKNLPINSPFWFIRDLMVVVVLSPIVYILIKKLHLFAVLLIGAIWVCNPYFYLPGWSTVSFFFFSAGAYFSLHKKNFVLVMKSFLPWPTPCYILLLVGAFYSLGKGWWSYIYCANVLVGLISVVAVTASFIEKGRWRPNYFLASASFFIFAYHRLPLVFIIKLLFNQIRPQTDAALLFLYFLCPAIVILLGLLFYWAIKKLLPSFTAVICGGRLS